MTLDLTLTEQATVWQRALRARYVTAAAAVAWADALINHLDSPPDSLLNVSLGGHLHPADLAPLLTDLAQEDADSPRILAGELQLMAETLGQEPGSASLMAWALRDLSDGPLRNHPFASEMFVLPYAWDPDEVGWSPTPAEAIKRLGEMVRQLRAECAAAV